MDIQPPHKRARQDRKQHPNFFNGNDKNLHDVVVNANSEKFFCSKKDLARHSPFFNRLFFGPHAEKDISDIQLPTPFGSAKTFQLYLELTNGSNNVREDQVLFLLGLSDWLEAPVPLDRTEQFLMIRSIKSPKEKFELGVKYKLDKLMTLIITEIQDSAQLTDIIPADHSNLSQNIKELILNKTLELLGVKKSPFPISHQPQLQELIVKNLSRPDQSTIQNRLMAVCLNNSPVTCAYSLEKLISELRVILASVRLDQSRMMSEWARRDGELASETIKRIIKEANKLPDVSVQYKFDASSLTIYSQPRNVGQARAHRGAQNQDDLIWEPNQGPPQVLVRTRPQPQQAEPNPGQPDEPAQPAQNQQDQGQDVVIE